MRRAAALVLLCVVLHALPAAAAEEEALDYLIRGARVFDGTTERSRRADVGIRGERIAAVGDLSAAKAARVIDAKGLVLTPGFIDAHTHSDFNPFVYPDLANKILQGVTTEVTGNCGMSAAPVLGGHAGQIQGVWAREGVDIGSTVSWKTFAEYGRALEAKGMRTNFVGLAGHGNLRAAVMGFEARPATDAEIREMSRILAEAVDEGAAGVSFGLIYLPGIFAEEKELVELCRTAGGRGGLCAFHMRSEGAALEQAVSEAVRIGKEAGARIQISHLKAAGKDNWPKIGAAFSLIEAAGPVRNVEADAYPYTASYAELGVMLPEALYRRPDRVEYFRNPANRPALAEELGRAFAGKDWRGLEIASVPNPAFRRYEGKTIADLARESGKDPVTALIEVLAETSFEASAFSFGQSEDVIRKVLARPYVAVGSDSIADGSRKPHPRAFGTFPRILARYVGPGGLTMGAAIRKMTSVPAEYFGLKDRGRIEPGYAADLILFDPARFRDLATYEDPARLAAGMQWVFVGGTPEVENGRPTTGRAGRLLRPGRPQA